MDGRKANADDEASALQSSTGFLDLSAELRNEIYRLVLCAEMEKDGVLWVDWRQEDKALYRLDSSPFELTPAILCTCKQVHAEAASMLYGEYIFAMRPETLLKIVPRHSDFTAQTRLLRLYLSSHDVSDLVYIRQCGISNPTIEKTCKALGNLTNLRELSLGGEVRCDFFRYGKPPTLGSTMAKNLWPIVELMLMKSNKAEVHKVLEIEFRPGFMDTLFSDESDDLQERLDIMQENAYKQLEASTK